MLNTFELLTLIDIARLIPLFAVIGYAAIFDFLKGEVTNKIWLYAPIGLAASLLEYALLTPNLLTIYFISITICVATALGLFYFTKDFGGADAKALITLALCYPLAPAYLAFLPCYPLLIICTAAILATAVAVVRRKKETRFIPLHTNRLGDNGNHLKAKKLNPFVGVGFVAVALLILFLIGRQSDANEAPHESATIKEVLAQRCPHCGGALEQFSEETAKCAYCGQTTKLETPKVS